MKVQRNRSTQLTYNNIKYTVVLDCDLTVYLLNNSYTHTHARARCGEKLKFLMLNPAIK